MPWKRFIEATASGALGVQDRLIRLLRRVLDNCSLFLNQDLDLLNRLSKGWVPITESDSNLLKLQLYVICVYRLI